MIALKINITYSLVYHYYFKKVCFIRNLCHVLFTVFSFRANQHKLHYTLGCKALCSIGFLTYNFFPLILYTHIYTYIFIIIYTYICIHMGYYIYLYKFCNFSSPSSSFTQVDGCFSGFLGQNK